MAYFIVRSKSAPDWGVYVADCSAEHAENVRAQLTAEPEHPSDLYVQELDGPYGKPKTASKKGKAKS